MGTQGYWPQPSLSVPGQPSFEGLPFGSETLQANVNVPDTNFLSVLGTPTLPEGTYLVNGIILIASATTGGDVDILLAYPGVNFAALTVAIPVATYVSSMVGGIVTLPEPDSIQLVVDTGISGGPVGAVIQTTSKEAAIAQATMLNYVRIA